MIEQAFNPFEDTLKKGNSPVAILFVIGLIALLAYLAFNEKGFDNVKNQLRKVLPGIFKDEPGVFSQEL